MRLRFALTAWLATAAAPALAAQWIDLGARATGMGGAYVGIAEGPLASYWNPAGLGLSDETIGVSIPFGMRGEIAGPIIEGARTLHEAATECNSGNCDAAKILRAVDSLAEDGNAMLGDAAAGVDARFKRFGLFFNVSYGVGATPIVDRVNVLPGTIQNNQSRVLVRGFNGYEFGAAYGQELGESGVMVGGAFKGIVGRVGFSAISAVDKDIAVGDIVGDFDHDAETSVRPGIDLGVLWKIAKTVRGLPADPTLGLVGRNLNSPKFDQPPEGKAAGERDLPLNAQVRGGASVSPLPFWRIALDLDLTENDTLAHHFRSRFISAGTEVNIIDSKALNLPLRFGITKNVAEGSSHVALTGGFGLNLAHATIDFALGASPSTENTDVEDNSNDVPTNFYAAIQVGATF